MASRTTPTAAGGDVLLDKLRRTTTTAEGSSARANASRRFPPPT